MNANYITSNPHRRLSRGIIIGLILSLFPAYAPAQNSAPQKAKADKASPAPKNGTNTPYPAQLRYGGTLKVNLGSVVSLDSQKAVDENSLLVINSVQQGIYGYDEQGRLTLRLACDYPKMQDELTYTILLQPGVYFHDGHELQAADMAATWERLINPATQAPARFLFDNIESVTALDTHTIQVRLKKPDNTLGYLFARPELYPLSPQALKLYGENYGRINITGTGPFQLTEWKPGEQISLTRNTRYAGNGLPYLSTLIFQCQPDRQSGFEQLQKRQVSMAAFITPDQAKGMSPKLKLLSVTGLKLVQVYLNLRRPPFDNPLVRQALACGIDRQAIANTVYQGYATPAASFMPPWHWAHKPDFAPFTYSTQAARELLEKSPYWFGQKLEFDLMYAKDNPLFGQIAGLIKRQLAEVGFNVNLRPLSKPEILNYIYGRQKGRQTFAAAIGDWQGPLHPDGFSYLLYSSASPYNKVKYSNPLVDSAFELARQAEFNEDKAAMYQAAEEVITPDANTIYLNFPHYIYAYNTYVGGLKVSPTGMIDFEQVWIYK